MKAQILFVIVIVINSVNLWASALEENYAEESMKSIIKKLDNIITDDVGDEKSKNESVKNRCSIKILDYAKIKSSNLTKNSEIFHEAWEAQKLSCLLHYLDYIQTKITELQNELVALKKLEVQARINSDEIDTGLDSTDLKNCYKIILAKINFYRKRIVLIDNARREIEDSVIVLRKVLSEISDYDLSNLKSYKAEAGKRIEEILYNAIISSRKIRKILEDKYHALTDDYNNLLIHGRCGNKPKKNDNPDYSLIQKELSPEYLKQKLIDIQEQLKESDENYSKFDHDKIDKYNQLVQKLGATNSSDEKSLLELEIKRLLEEQKLEFDHHKSQINNLLDEYKKFWTIYAYVKHLYEKINNNNFQKRLNVIEQKTNELNIFIIKHKLNMTEAIQLIYGPQLNKVESGHPHKDSRLLKIEYLEKIKNFVKEKLYEIENRHKNILNLGNEISKELDNLFAKAQGEDEKKLVEEEKKNLAEILADENSPFNEKRKMILSKHQALSDQQEILKKDILSNPKKKNVNADSIIRRMNEIGDLIIALQKSTDEKYRQLNNKQANATSKEEKDRIKVAKSQLMDSEKEEYRKYRDEWKVLADKLETLSE